MILRDLLSKQITHLNIDITQTTEECSGIIAKNFSILISLCGRLTDLNFCDVFLTRKCWFFVFPLRLTDYVSSTLVKLKINVATFMDCLLLLDGRLESLSILIINVASIAHPRINVDRVVSTIACIVTYSCVFFTEETPKAEVFITRIVPFHISL